MKKTKKLLSVLMATIICISSFAVCNLSAYAAGWIDTVQEIDFDSVYTESCSKSDASSKKYYYDAFMFNVPTSGKIKLTVEAESIDYVQNWFYNYYTPFSIYDVNNLNEALISLEYDKKTFNSAYNCYHIECNFDIKNPGIYYLVASYNREYFEKYNEYQGSYDFTISFTPNITNVSLSKIISKKKSFKVNYPKCSNVSGYQLQYGTNKNMKSAKTINLSSSSSSKTIKNLKSKKNYYVRIRTYKTVNINGSNKTYYGKWSPKKSVKTK